MLPNKIIIYTRTVQVHFHVKLAQRLSKKYPQAKVLFVSFFSQAVELVKQAGFEALHFPLALQSAHENPISQSRIREIDDFCRKEYMGLNGMIQIERFLPNSREGVSDFMIRHLTVLDEIVEENTLSISSMYDHFFYLAAGMLAIEKGGAHFSFIVCGVPSGRVVAFKTPHQLWINKQSKEDPKQLFEETRRIIDQPPEVRVDYMKDIGGTRRPPLLERIRKARTIARYRKRDYEAGSYFVENKKSWMANAVAWRLQRWRTPKSSKAWDIRTSSELNQISKPCVFLALHMEPEASILLYSPRWRDQLEICRLVAEALPVDYVLLVKENPRMVDRRPDGYYAHIKRFPNVRLVSTAVSSSDLVKKSTAVVSIGGTVTLEARLQGKLAFCFGRPPFYKFATACGSDILDHLQFLKPEQGKSSLSANDENWASWIRSTFPGQGSKSKYSPQLGYMTWNDCDENVDAHYYFILGALD